MRYISDLHASIIGNIYHQGCALLTSDIITSHAFQKRSKRMRSGLFKLQKHNIEAQIHITPRRSLFFLTVAVAVGFFE